MAEGIQSIDYTLDVIEQTFRVYAHGPNSSSYVVP